MMRLAAHYWSIAPSLAHRVRPARGPVSEPWAVTVPDAAWGSVRLTGLYARHPDARGLVLIVHGMGGRPTSHYAVRAANAAWSAGLSSLRLALRGADRQGEDFYHAGLTADLRAALESPEARAHETLHVIGYSLGGHVTLRLAVEGVPGLRSVAAVCAPLDLVTTARALDHEVAPVYRHYVLGGLKSIYREVARRRPVPTPVAQLMRARTVREWDEMAVVPRHGFASPDAYYEGESVAPRLRSLTVPSLLVATEGDPMVPVRTTRDVVRAHRGALEFREVARGGHVGFPGDLDLGLGLPSAPGLERQVVSWLLSHPG